MRRAAHLIVSALITLVAPATPAGAKAKCPRPRNYPVSWDRLAQVESGGRWHLDALYDGGLQHHPPTWNAYKRCAGVTAAFAYQATRAEQIAVARYVMGAQGVCAWPLSSKRLGVASCGR